MKTDDLTTSKVTPIRQDALPELSTIRSALSNDSRNAAVNAEHDRIAMEIAESARNEWNQYRKAEIAANKSLADDSVQSAMASEVFEAFLTYLKTIPSGVQEKVIAKFHAINLPDSPKKVITL